MQGPECVGTTSAVVPPQVLSTRAHMHRQTCCTPWAATACLDLPGDSATSCCCT